MNLFDLYCKIALDTSEVDSGIMSTSEKLLQAKKNIENVGTAVKNAAKTFATIGAGVVAAGTAVFGFANNISQTGDNIDKMSQKLGMSAEAYQEWSHILEHCGTSIDSMQASMKTLATAAETGSDAFEKLGLSQEAIASMSQEDLFAATIEALQNVESETERTYLAGQLLGRGATELGPLLNTSAEEIEAMRQNLHDMGAVMSDEAVKNSAAFQDSLTNLKTAFSGASNSLGSELIPKFTSLMDRVTAFIADGGIDKIIDGFRNLAPVITAATAAMVAYKSASAISGVIDAVTKATQAQTIAQTLLNAVMNANPFVLIATLIAGLAAALITLWNTNEGFREAVTSAWEKIKEVFSVAVNAIGGFFTETIPAVFNAVVEFFTVTVPNAISSFVDSIGTFFTETIPAFFESLVQWFSELPEKIAYWLGFAIGKLISWGQEAIEWVITEVPKIIDNIVNFFAELPEKIWEWLVSAVKKIAEWVTNANAKAQEVRGKVIETIVNFFKELPGKIWTWLTETISKIGSFITDMGTKIKTEVPKIITTFINFFKELPGKILEIGKNIVDGLWNGIKNAWSNLTSKVTGLFGSLVSGIKNGLGIASPSKVFASIGGFMAEGLGEGWADEYGSIKKQIEGDMDFGTAKVDFASSGIGQYSGALQSMFADLSASMSQNMTIVVQSVLDGRVIGETAYQYSKDRQRAYGVT